MLQLVITAHIGGHCRPTSCLCNNLIIPPQELSFSLQYKIQLRGGKKENHHWNDIGGQGTHPGGHVETADTLG